MVWHTLIKRILAAAAAIVCAGYAWHVYDQQYRRDTPQPPPARRVNSTRGRPATNPAFARRSAPSTTQMTIHRAPPDPFNFVDTQTPRRFNGHTDTVRCVALSADKTRLITGGNDRTVRLWDFASGKEIRSFEGHSGFVRGVDFSPDANRIISCSEDRTIRIWDANTGEQLSQLDGHQNRVIGVSFLSDSNQAISASFDGTVRIWDIDKEITLHKIQYEGQICSMAVSVPHNLLAVGTHSGHVYLLDLTTRTELRELDPVPQCIEALVFSTDGTRLAISPAGGLCRVIDSKTGKKVFEEDESQKENVYNLALSPDAQYLGLGRHLEVIFYDLKTGQRCKNSIRSWVFQTQAMCFVPDSSLLVTVGGGFLDKSGKWMTPREEKVLIWNLPRPLP